MKSKKKRKIVILLGIVLIIAAGIIVKAVIERNSFKKREPIEVSKLSDSIYHMDDNGEATGYIVVGKEKAVVIDTMNGIENSMDIVRSITDLPTFVINTHGHLDHIYGDAYYDEVYIHPDDIALAKENFAYPQYKKLSKKNKFDAVDFKTTKEGDSFDLGGITLKIYDIPGHTQGGICILDVEDRVLFTGDSINRHCWMQLDCRTSMEEFYKNLENLGALKGEYDYILHGHAQGFEDASLYDEHMATVKEVIDGVNADADEDYKYFGGTCKIHYNADRSVGIVYR